VLEGSHDGFSNLPGHPIHVRRFSITPCSIAIEDRIEGATDRAASVSFLLHPECKIETSGRHALILRDDVRIEMTSTLPIRREPAPWWPDMGVERATSRLRIELGAGERAAATTLKVMLSGAAIAERE
jgi:hypothetical protein